MRYVLERFPDHWPMIKKLLRESEDFRVLCADLADAVEAERRWRASGEPAASVRAAEFSELTREIEVEILERLSNLRSEHPPECGSLKERR